MPDGHLLCFGPYQLDANKEQFWCDNQPVRLPPKAFQVLRYLVGRPGQLVTKEELFRVVWAETMVGDAALTMCVQELRKALQDNTREPQYIETVHRRGFRFIAEVVSSQYPVVRREEPSANGQAVATVMSALRLHSGQAPTGVQESQAQAGGDSFWIPADSGMIQPGATPPNLTPTPQLDPLLHAPAFPAQRSWSIRGLMLMGLMLLVGVVLTVQYLSRPTLSTQSSELGTEPAPQALPLPAKPSIIVLPCTNMSEDPTQEYFSDGMTEELTSSLSRLPSLFVIARHSAFTYKGKAVKVQEVGREMGVRYVLEGSVRKAGEQLRITTQLIDATTGGHIWSERYDRQMRDIFALRDEITQQTVATLRIEIGKAELARVRRIPTENLTTYDLYLRGLESSFRVST